MLSRATCAPASGRPSVVTAGSGGDAPPGRAYRRALGLLARREHSRAELLVKLRRSGHGRGEAERAVEILVERDLVSDSRFAEAFIRSRVERGSGPLRIRRDLEARGVDTPVVERLLDADDETWEARARSVREKRFGAPAPAPGSEATRQARFLLGRGFTRRQVRRAIGPATGENGWE